MPQSLANVPVHLVFSTYQRVPLLPEPVRPKLHAYVVGILRNIGCTPIQVGGVEDHLHVLYGLGRTVTMSEVASKVKSNSTTWLKENCPLCKGFSWQSGYATYGIGTPETDNL